jgi:hypothetical protein
MLQKKSWRFPIDRIYFGGSVGKSTAIISPDFDCTVFVNEEQPPFAEVLDEFEDILLMSDGLKIVPNTIKTTRYSLQFVLEGGYEVDLLPAANLVKLGSGPRASTEDIGELQRGKVLQKIMGNPKEGKFYSSSLAETQINFMKDQDAFCHALVRLAKFWYKSVYLGEYVDGAKTIMELIATAASKREEKHGGKSMSRAFMTFLEMLSKINSLKILFHQQGKNWELFDDNELKSMTASGGTMKRSVRGMPGMKTLLHDYFIVEPGNPFNDMAEQLNKTVIEKLIAFSTVTKKRLEDIVLDLSKPGNCKGFPFQELFDPQPTKLFKEITPVVHTDSLPLPKVMISMSSVTSMNSDLKITKKDKYQQSGAKNFVKGVETFLFSTVNACVRSNSKNTAEDVYSTVKRMLSEKVLRSDQHWGPSYRTEEDFDVTIGVPFTTASGETKQVRVSLGW